MKQVKRLDLRFNNKFQKIPLQTIKHQKKYKKGRFLVHLAKQT